MSSAAVALRRQSTDSARSSSNALQRSRTWSENVQKHWVLPALPTETLDQRVARYSEYFKLKNHQLHHVMAQLMAELEKGAAAHSSATGCSSSVKMLDTAVVRLPDGDEKGMSYCLDFSGTQVRAVKAKLEGGGRVTLTETRASIQDYSTEYPKGLMDRNCGAMQLFDFLAGVVEQLMKKAGDHGKNKPDVNVSFVLAFPIEQQKLSTGTILNWTKGFETGRATSDRVEGLDLATLLNMAFWRRELNAKCNVVSNGTVSTLVGCQYEKPRKLPPCSVAFVSGNGVNGVYAEPQALKYGYAGDFINTELGGFDCDLPVTDVDLEIDYAEDGSQGQQIFEKMIGGAYVGEICRRLVVRVFQADTPTLAWARKSMPTAAAAFIVSDTSEELTQTDRLLQGLWEWSCDLNIRKTVQNLFRLVFDRSAALSAVSIAALAKKSSRLQPAMGGVTVAVDATVHAFHAWYSDLVRTHLKEILGDAAALINLYVIHDGACKGGAIINETAKNQVRSSY